MADTFVFAPKKDTVIIKDREYTLAPRNKALVAKLESLKKSFQKPGITFDDLLRVFRSGIDMLLGDGSFSAIFASEEDADIDEIAALYAFLIGKYQAKNSAYVAQTTKIKKK